MPYLILNGDKTICAGKASRLTMEVMRKALEKHNPGKQVHGPLEPNIPGAEVVSVYLSPSEDGIGRVQDRFYLWLVSR